MEQRQTLPQSFAREIKEETGLDIQIRRPICFWDEITDETSKYPYHLYFVLFCECWLIDDNQEVQLSDEHHEIFWATEQECRNLHMTCGNQEALDAYFGMR